MHILLQQNISNKSLDLYIELRSNISSLSWDKHIDCRYIPRCKPIIVGAVYINAERQIMMKSIHADKQFMWSNNDELAIAMNWPRSWFLATLHKLICFTNHWYISIVDKCYAFDIFRSAEWELYLPPKVIDTNDTSLRKEGGGPSYLNFIQTECHKRDKKLLL